MDDKAEDRLRSNDSDLEMDEAEKQPLQAVEVDLEVNVNRNGAAGNGQTATIADSIEEAYTGCLRCCQRTNIAHCCIDKWELNYTKTKKKDPRTGEEREVDDAHLTIVLIPEAFRMWFYYGWYDVHSTISFAVLTQLFSTAQVDLRMLHCHIKQHQY